MYNNILKGNWCFSSELIFDDNINYFLHNIFNQNYNKHNLVFNRVLGKKHDSINLKTEIINLVDQINEDETNVQNKLSSLINKIVNDYFNSHQYLKFEVKCDKLVSSNDLFELEDENITDFENVDGYINQRVEKQKQMILRAIAIGASEIACKSFYNYVDEIDEINPRLSQAYIRLGVLIDKYVLSDDKFNFKFKNDSYDTSEHDYNPIIVKISSDNFLFALKAAFLHSFCLLLKCDPKSCIDDNYEDYKKVGEYFYRILIEDVRDTSNIIPKMKYISNLESNELLTYFKEGLLRTKNFKNINYEG